MSTPGSNLVSGDAQAFLADFLMRNQVARADRTVGRFRSFLVGSPENSLHNEWRRRSAQKRGGGQVPISLDTVNAEERFTREPQHAEIPAAAHDGQWARALVDEALAELQREWERDGRGSLFQECQAHLWGDATSLP